MHHLLVVTCSMESRIVLYKIARSTWEFVLLVGL